MAELVIDLNIEETPAHLEGKEKIAFRQKAILSAKKIFQEEFASVLTGVSFSGLDDDFFPVVIAEAEEDEILRAKSIAKGLNSLVIKKIQPAIRRVTRAPF